MCETVQEVFISVHFLYYDPLKILSVKDFNFGIGVETNIMNDAFARGISFIFVTVVSYIKGLFLLTLVFFHAKSGISKYAELELSY